MNDVKFPINGTFKVTTSEDGQITAAGTGILIDPETGSVIASAALSGSSDFTVEDAHTSKDEYIVAAASYGKVGTSAPQIGFSPTDEVVVHRYQWRPNHITDGNVLETYVSGTNFEDISMGDLQVQSLYGSGGVTYSGIRNATVLDGDYYFSARASSFRSYWLEPVASGAVGLTCGRTVYLAKYPDSTSANRNGEVGFAFLRQGALPEDDGYKVFMLNRFSDDTRRDCETRVGDISGSNGDQLQDRGSLHWNTSVLYDSSSDKSDESEVWMMVEWEVISPSGALINVAYQPYSPGDTFESIADTWRPIYQVYDLRNPYISTALKPTWILSSRANSSQGDVGIDNVWLQKLEALPRQGLNVYRPIHANITGSARPIVANYFGAGGPGTPSGWPSTSPRHPLVRAEDSPTGIDGEGSAGIRCSRGSGSNGNRTTAMFDFYEATASGITHGVARMIYDTGTTSFGGTPKVGFSFLRQGDSWNSNAYTIEFYPNSSSDWRVRLRKGKIYSDTFDESADFQGSTLSTSSTLHNSSGDMSWIEVRWKVESGSQVRIEILHKEVDQSYTTFDTSPGNVDNELTQVISYNDVSSPYTSTTLTPMHIIRGSNGSAWLRATELRRIKE